MLKRGSYFSEQSRDEKVELFTRRHWISFFLPWGVVSIILTIFPLIIYFTILDFLLELVGIYWLIVGSAIYYLFNLGIFLYAWMNYYLNVTIVTTEHLVNIRQDGWFNRRVAEQSLLRVQDVSSRMKGLLQTFFRYGKVVVETAGDTPNFEIPNVPRPYRVANVIMKLHQEMVESGRRQTETAEAEGMLMPHQESNPASKVEEELDLGEGMRILERKANFSSHQPSEQVRRSRREFTPSNEVNDLTGNLEEGKVVQLR